MAAPEIITRALSGSTERNDPVLSQTLNLLRQPTNFRTALPLYRRLQFGQFLEASFLLTSPSLDESTPNGNPDATDPWLAAFVDRSRRPETEVWLFGSWEKAPATKVNGVPTNPPHDHRVSSLLRSLLATIKSLGLPPSIHASPTPSPDNTNTDDDDDKDTVGNSRSSYAAHLANPNIMLWGAVHAASLPYLKDLGVVASWSDNTWVPNHMFIFSVDTLPESKPLPESVRWGKLGKEHFALVKSRTQIPRQDRTMAVLPNLALFPTRGTEEEKNSPVAWAFVGLDSSLTTLHVEPEYRRLGLAKAVTTKLLREEMDVFWEDGMERLAQGYVIVGNEASAGMCRALGGKADWEVYWIRVDLGQI